MLNLVVVGAWLALLVGLGLWKARAVKGQEGFSLAGRGLPLPVLLGTLLATWTGTGSVFGNAEKAGRDGFAALVLCLGPTLGFLVLIVLAGRVRAAGRYTLQDLLEERFGPLARVLGTLTLVSAYLVIVSYQLRAAASVMVGLLADAGAPMGEGGQVTVLIAVTLVIGVYTALGGLLSVAFTDTLNGVLLTMGLLLALPVTWRLAGGVDGVLAALPAGHTTWEGHYTIFDLVSLTLPTFLLVLGDANLHARFLAARSDRTARAAAALLIPATLLVDGAIILLALGGHALLGDLPAGAHVVPELARGPLPEALGALLMAAVVAIIVSTADSYLLTSSSSLLRDVYQRFVRPAAGEAELLAVARRLVLALSGLALVMALQGGGFFEVAFLAYTIYGVGITPVLLAALFWRRATPAGAVASLLVAGSSTALWTAFGWDRAAARALGLPEGAQVEAVVPGMLLATAALVGVSLVTRPRAPAL